jgi:hypothetical protein
MSPAATDKKDAKSGTVGDDLGAGFVVSESREGYHEAYNAERHVNILSVVDLETLQKKIDSYGVDHPEPEATPQKK